MEKQKIGGNMSKKKELLILGFLMIAGFLFSQNKVYFGLKSPGRQPVVFAPGLISTDNMEFYLSFSKDLKMCLLCRVDKKDVRGPSQIIYMVKKDSKWSEQKIVPHRQKKGDGYFILSPKGKEIYFASNRPLPGTKSRMKKRKLWKMVYKNDRWEKPVFVDLARNNDYGIGHPSLTNDGTVCFYSDSKVSGIDEADIFYSKFKNGRYGNIINPGKNINTTANECDPFIDPDGKYILIATSKDKRCIGDFDIFISFKNKDGSWTKTINLGANINSKHREIYPRVSPDGKYIFFSSNRNGNWDIYWVDAGIIKNLRKRMIK